MAPSAAMEETPNWLEMPPELMASILKRLGAIEILKSGRKVCTSWRRICKDPAMWKVINLFEDWIKGDANNDLEKVTKEAVDLSCGELIDITIYDDSATDDLLDYIVQRSSKLQRLCLDYSKITCSVLSLAVKRLPELEELHLTILLIGVEDIEVIGRNCPQLKSFMMDKMSFWAGMNCDDDARAIAKSMPELRHLQLLGSEITDDGLQAIRNGCPHLQSLDVQKSSNFDFFGSMLKVRNEHMQDIMLFAAELQALPDDYD